MPLDNSIRDQVSSIPSLEWIESPERRNLTYKQFNFDEKTDKLGEGQNAIVYRADVPTENLTVALKKPYPGTVDRKTINQMPGEAERWASVHDHPYIVGIVDWSSGARPWIAMEYMDGGSLNGREFADNLDQRLWTAYSIVDGVAYAGGMRGLAHLDINPNNILFQNAPEGQWNVPKVGDWGLARELIRQSGSVSQVTPDYGAPEQFQALRPDAELGVRTDVYQLGLVCYELLTGQYPNHLDPEAVLPPTQIESGLPTQIDDILMKALAHNPNHRFEHSLLLKAELEEVVESVLSDQYTSNGKIGAVGESANTDDNADRSDLDEVHEETDGLNDSTKSADKSGPERGEGTSGVDELENEDKRDLMKLLISEETSNSEASETNRSTSDSGGKSELRPLIEEDAVESQLATDEEEDSGGHEAARDSDMAIDPGDSDGGIRTFLGLIILFLLAAALLGIALWMDYTSGGAGTQAATSTPTPTTPAQPGLGLFSGVTALTVVVLYGIKNSS